MKKASMHQLSTMIFLNLITLNFISLPAQVFKSAKIDSWMVILFNMILELVVILFIIFMLKKSGKRNFYEFLTALYGKVIAKIILIALFGSYLISLMRATTELDAFISFNIYESTFSWLYFALPLLAVVGYMASKGTRNLGRLSELVYPILAIGILLVIAVPLTQVDWMFFSPMLKDGFGVVLESMLSSISWFGSGLFVFAMFGDFDFNEKRHKTLWFFLLAAFVLTMLVSVVFYGLFEMTANQHAFALADISQVVSSSSSLYRLQWILVSLWIICLVGFTASVLFSGARCLSLVFNQKNSNYAIIFIMLILGVWLYLYKQNTDITFILNSKAVAWYCLAVNFVLPLILFVTTLIRRKKLETPNHS